jgi:hypothetical protein
MEDIKSHVTAELRRIPKEAFCRCFQQWQDCGNKCVCAQESYFEGDYVNVAVCPTITVQYHHSGNFLTAPRKKKQYEVQEKLHNINTGTLFTVVTGTKAVTLQNHTH